MCPTCIFLQKNTTWKKRASWIQLGRNSYFTGPLFYVYVYKRFIFMFKVFRLSVSVLSDRQIQSVSVHKEFLMRLCTRKHH